MYTLTAFILTSSVWSLRLWLADCLHELLSGLKSLSLLWITLESSVGVVNDHTHVSFISPLVNFLACSQSVFNVLTSWFLFLCVFAATGCGHYGVLCSGSRAGRPGWDVLQQLFPLCAISAGPGPIQHVQPVGAQWEAGAGAIRRPSGTVTSTTL